MVTGLYGDAEIKSKSIIFFMYFFVAESGLRFIADYILMSTGITRLIRENITMKCLCCCCCCLPYVTVFRKINRSARKSIIAYARKYTFEHEDANGNKEK